MDWKPATAQVGMDERECGLTAHFPPIPQDLHIYPQPPAPVRATEVRSTRLPSMSGFHCS